MESIALNQNTDHVSNDAQSEEVDEGTKGMLLSKHTEAKELNQDKDFQTCEMETKDFERTQSIYEDLLKYRAIEEQRLQEIGAVNAESRRRSREICRQAMQRLRAIEKAEELALKEIIKECEGLAEKLIAIGRTEMIKEINKEYEETLVSLLLLEHLEIEELGEEYKHEVEEKYDRQIQKVREDTERRIQLINSSRPTVAQRTSIDILVQADHMLLKNRLSAKCELRRNYVNTRYEREIRQHYEACGRKIQAVYSNCIEKIQEIDTDCESEIQENYKEIFLRVKEHEECDGRKRHRCEERNEQIRKICANHQIQKVYKRYGRRIYKLRRDYYNRINRPGYSNKPIRNKYEDRNFEISVLHHDCNEQIREILDEYDTKNKKVKTS